MLSYHKVKEAHEAFLAMSKVDRIMQIMEDRLIDPKWLRGEFSTIHRNSKQAMELHFTFLMTTTEAERNEISARLTVAGWLKHAVIDYSHTGNALLFVNLSYR